MSEKKPRKPKCPCGTNLTNNGTCPYRCELFKRPHERVKSYEQGRPEVPISMLTHGETTAAFKALGFPALPTSPNAGVRRRAS